MVKVTCGYTGIEFEADTRRTKNHPAISAALQNAYKAGRYGAAMDAIKTGKEVGFTTIEQFIALIEQSDAQEQQCQLEAFRAERARKETIAEAKKKRALLNSFLGESGYHWKKAEDDEEDDIEETWTLFYDRDPRNLRIVTVREAMTEITSNAETEFARKKAQTWLDEHPAPQKPAPEPEPEAKGEPETQTQGVAEEKDEYTKNWIVRMNAAIREQRAKTAEIERTLFAGLEKFDKWYPDLPLRDLDWQPVEGQGPLLSKAEYQGAIIYRDATDRHQSTYYLPHNFVVKLTEAADEWRNNL